LRAPLLHADANEALAVAPRRRPGPRLRPAAAPLDRE